MELYPLKYVLNNNSKAIKDGTNLVSLILWKCMKDNKLFEKNLVKTIKKFMSCNECKTLNFVEYEKTKWFGLITYEKNLSQDCICSYGYKVNKLLAINKDINEYITMKTLIIDPNKYKFGVNIMFLAKKQLFKIRDWQYTEEEYEDKYFASFNEAINHYQYLCNLFSKSYDTIMKETYSSFV
jgi:hypothetical protein